MTNRKQLEQAITAQESLRGTLDDAIVDATITALREKLAALEAKGREQQRKLVTVLFADVSGFTAMSEKLDAEDVNDIMNALWERLDKAIIDHGGFIDKHIGDAVMALWGAEVAQENDPEQAIRAALATQTTLAAFREERKLALAMRIGINTGPVLLGEVGTTGEFTAMGDAVNTASRLEHAAPVDSILISHDTYRHVRGIFDVETLDPIAIRGKSELLQVYVVRRAKPRAFRRTTRGVEGVETRMIGRDAELKRLQDALLSVQEEGELQMVTVVGDAGVGKSRLLYEFENWLDVQPEPMRLFKGRAGLEFQHLPYGLLRDIFLFRFQILEDDSATAVHTKIERGIAEGLRTDIGSEMKAHFIGQLLGFDFKASPHLQNVLDDAQQLHDRALMYLGEYFKAINIPVVILLEDIHWADDSSLDMLTRLARILIVSLARPILYERRPYWGEGQEFYARLNIHPLSKRDSRRLVEEILQKATQIPEALRELIVENAEGNPFYAEELIKMLIDEGVIIKGEAKWQVMAERLTGLRVPATLTEVLQARLESLSPEERTVLQQASVVGRIFWDRTLQHLNQTLTQGLSGEAIHQQLDTLRAREMVFQRETSSFSEAREHIFKHALLRDVTYESVLKRLRQAYHALIAQWLIEQGGERSSEYTGLIAEHLELAGERENAIRFLKKAGEAAAAKYANEEAVEYFSRALELTPEGELEGRYALIQAREKIYNLQGKREPQLQDLAALQKLADEIGDNEKRAETILRQTTYYFEISEFSAALQAAQEVIRLAQAIENIHYQAEGYLLWGAVLWKQLDKSARSRVEQALQFAKYGGELRLEGRCLRMLGNIFAAIENDIDSSKNYYEQALQIFRELGNRGEEGSIFINLGNISLTSDFVRAKAYLEQALNIARKTGDRSAEFLAIFNLGMGYHALGKYTQASACAEQSLKISQEIGNKFYEYDCYVYLGEILLEQGDFTAAKAQFDGASKLSHESSALLEGRGAPLYNLGYLYQQLGDYSTAESLYKQVLQISREPGLRSDYFGLIYLGLLAHDQGKNEMGWKTCQQAIQWIHDKFPNTIWQGDAFTVTGHLLGSLGQFAEGTIAYQNAISIWRKVGKPRLATEPLAGLARVLMAQGETEKALGYVEEIMDHMKIENLDGSHDPFRIYLTCYQVLLAYQDPRAHEILETAHTLLMDRATKTPGEESRRSFLENVPWHRELVAVWEAQHQNL